MCGGLSSVASEVETKDTARSRSENTSRDAAPASGATRSPQTWNAILRTMHFACWWEKLRVVHCALAPGHQRTARTVPRTNLRHRGDRRKIIEGGAVIVDAPERHDERRSHRSINHLPWSASRSPQERMADAQYQMCWMRAPLQRSMRRQAAAISSTSAFAHQPCSTKFGPQASRR